MSGKALWVPLDVNFLWDPAVLGCSVEAQLLYVRSLCLSKQLGSDGLVDKKQVASLCFGLLDPGVSKPDLASVCLELVDCNLWVEHGFAYEIRSWAKYNKTAEEREELSKVRADAGRKGGQAKRKQVASEPGSKTKQSREEKSREEGESSLALAVPAPNGNGRRRDVVWEALLAVCGVDPSQVTSHARGRYNKAAKDLRDVGADPEEIARRGQTFRNRWPDASLTPNALASRWGECDPDRQHAPIETDRGKQILRASRRQP